MADPASKPMSYGWTRAETAKRQLQAGARMTPAGRLDWLEEMLDELLPLVGRAREASRPCEGEVGNSADQQDETVAMGTPVAPQGHSNQEV